MFLFIVCPMLLIYYESNEKDTVIQRIKFAAKSVFPFFFFIILLIVILYFSAHNAWIPDQIGKQIFGLPHNYEDPKLKDSGGNPMKYLNLKLDFAESLMVFMLFISSCFFTVFGGFGLSAVPWDIFVDY